jgi:hypothetical protein
MISRVWCADAEFIDVSIAQNNPFLTDPKTAKQFALPPWEPSEKPACMLGLSGLTCTREEFFANLDTRQPARRPNTSPGYSNTGYIVLGYALQSITGHSFKESLQSLADALKLAATTVDVPDVSRGAILVNRMSSGFELPFGDAASTAGVFSSMNDLSQIGRSMLGSTFLDPNTTRAWLKPTTFTNDYRISVGRPWEIYRLDTKSPRGIIDIYVKSGDFGLYHTKLALVPDYNIGITAFVGGPGASDWLNDQIVDIVFPALEEVAREQADAAYAGTYTGPANSTNTTVIISTEAGKPGLGVEKWIINGTDILAAFSVLKGYDVNTESLRLLPTGLDRKLEDGTTEISWKALIDQPNERDSIFAACDTWFNPESIPYGLHSLDQVLFSLGSDGKATKLDLRAWKVKLQREG